MKLYAIKDAMIDTLDIFLESEQEEINKEFYQETMKVLKEELSHKSSNIIKYLTNLDGEVSTLKSEIDRLTKVKKVRERKIANLKSYLITTMQSLEKKKVETELGTYGLRKSIALKVLDINKIPEKYLREKREVTVDKRELSNFIKAGHIIEGATLVENYSLQIK
ncbi:hypothetical protein PM10SUCC1_33010 [Propionigenium maris DSM 9537]|uniref:Virus Gp157 n=1 Tax=Propionigenium maris DSM 9537 TaxID=1123000 RepID=A0A9W6GNR4_9FUSO|nr:siphovirus Gp157 family protein [Propionigenium maris]GLI57787.1 hypothetical protein PM10SUCC1_33010 [Propionigenium maris DSM 9537]